MCRWGYSVGPGRNSRSEEWERRLFHQSDTWFSLQRSLSSCRILVNLVFSIYRVLNLLSMHMLWINSSLFCLSAQSKALIPLQTEAHPETKQRVLTNYMFPQQPRSDEGKMPSALPTEAEAELVQIVEERTEGGKRRGFRPGSVYVCASSDTQSQWCPHASVCFVIPKGILFANPLFSAHQIYIFLNTLILSAEWLCRSNLNLGIECAWDRNAKICLAAMQMGTRSEQAQPAGTLDPSEGAFIHPSAPDLHQNPVAPHCSHFSLKLKHCL